jgi:signal transduction histidine kinase
MRRDEIGQLAKTLTRTHQSLRDERELRRAAERHALLGRMAASLAHEVRNPVSAIRLHAQLLEHASQEEAAVSRELIESEAGRIEELVSQWLNHARPVPPVLTEVDVVESLRQAVRLMEPQARHSGVGIEMDAETSLLIPADRHRVQQVFGNLLRNAVQAMPSGGTVTVRVLDEKTRVAVVFEDGGEGFSPAALARSGEPFYSEKEGGMGLGLAVAKEICLAHGGGLVAENRTGGGATVRVEFPKNPTRLPETNPPTSKLR